MPRLPKLPRPTGRVAERLDQLRANAKQRGAYLALGGVAVTTATLGAQATPATATEDATPTPEPIPPAAAAPFDDAAFDFGHVSPSGATVTRSGPTLDAIDVRLHGLPSTPSAPRVEAGALTLVLVTDGDELFGKARTVHDLVDALAADADHHALLASWFERAGLPTTDEVDLDLETLFALADVFEEHGVRASRAGVDIFRHQRGIGDDAPAARVVGQLLNEAEGAPYLDLRDRPSSEASQAIRFLRRLEDPAAFLAAVGHSIADDGAVAPAVADAIAQRASARGVDLTQDPDVAAARLLPIGPRPEGEAARYEWYARVVESEGHAFRRGPDAINIIGLRGFDVHHGPHDNTFGEWNDTMAFVWRDGDGVPHVVEYQATTDPGLARGEAPDVNGDGAGDIAHLRPGQYTYVAGTHKHRPTAGNPTINVPVDRDTNHDGDISPEERNASAQRGDVGYGINIHWGPGHGSGAVGGYSAGCQVLTLDYGSFQERIAPMLTANAEVPYTLVELDAAATHKLA